MSRRQGIIISSRRLPFAAHIAGHAEQGPFVIVDSAGIPCFYDDAIELLNRLNAYYHSTSPGDHDKFAERILEELYPDPRIKDNGAGRKGIVATPIKSVPPRLSRKGFIYLVRIKPDVFKIGLSKNVDTRMRFLKTEEDGDLSLIHSIAVDDMPTAERAFHYRFASKSLGRERFALTDSDVEWFISITRLSQAEIEQLKAEQ